ncbi:hypothetical protein DXC51_21375 [Eisenbergiella massiliensis]|uniref:Uncharacterized protein n=1 Tax=Eisenbergiella massiliensis TaxID=1720294 RepID=A0A3E3HYN4_9FIRM|nr:hypothetical protein DXC51_21375 [Eisenbergiella massiliensis]
MQIAPIPPGKQNAGQTVPWTGGNCITIADVSGDKTSSGQSDTRLVAGISIGGIVRGWNWLFGERDLVAAGWAKKN